MRISHLLFAVLVIGTVLGIARDEVGRVAVIVFFTGLGTVFSGLAAIMALFQTIGAFGEARSLSAAHVEALAATVVVLAVGSAIMLGLLFGGASLVQLAIP